MTSYRCILGAVFAMALWSDDASAIIFAGDHVYTDPVARTVEIGPLEYGKTHTIDVAMPVFVRGPVSEHETTDMTTRHYDWADTSFRLMGHGYPLIGSDIISFKPKNRVVERYTTRYNPCELRDGEDLRVCGTFMTFLDPGDTALRGELTVNLEGYTNQSMFEDKSTIEMVFGYYVSVNYLTSVTTNYEGTLSTTHDYSPYVYYTDDTVDVDFEFMPARAATAVPAPLGILSLSTAMLVLAWASRRRAA